MDARWIDRLPGLLCLLISFGQSMVSRSAAAAQVSLLDGREEGNSQLHVVNLDANRPTHLEVSFLRPSGELAAVVTREIAAGSFTVVHLSKEPVIPPGVFAVIARADRPIDLVTRHDWASGAGTVVESRVTPGREVVLPWVAWNGDQNTLLNLQNTSTRDPAIVTVSVNPWRAPLASIEMPLVIQAGGFATIDFARFPVLAASNRTWAWVRVTSSQRLAVTGVNDLLPPGRGVAGLEGGPVTAIAARSLAVPLLGNAYALSDPAVQLTSGVQVFNTGTITATARLSYTGGSEGCVGTLVAQGPFSIAAHSVATFFQGHAPGLPTGDPRLPDGCLVSATIEASEPVAAISGWYGSRRSTWAMSIVPPADRVATRLAVPLLASLDGRGPAGLLQVQNTNRVDSSVSLRLVDADGRPVPCDDPCQALVPAGGAAHWDLGRLLAGLNASVSGAWLESALPVMAVVLDPGWEGQDAVMFNAIVDQTSQEGVEALTRFVPSAMKDWVPPPILPMRQILLPLVQGR